MKNSVFPKIASEPYELPYGPAVIRSSGDVLNGRANLNHVLEIDTRSLLHYNIRNGVQPPLDAVLMSTLNVKGPWRRTT